MNRKEGIILKSMKYQETSKIIYVLTREGLESLLVKGASKMKSRNASYTQDITKVAFDYVESKNKSFSILTTGEVLENYSNIKGDYHKLQDAFLILEYAYQFHEHIEDYQTFYLFLSDILQRLNVGKLRIYPIIFQLKLLYLLGIGPVFSHCVNCGKKEDLEGFVMMSGGVKCTECLEAGEKFLGRDALTIVSFIYRTKLVQLTEEILEPLIKDKTIIEHFVYTYYQNYLSFESRVQRVLHKMK